MAFDKDRSRLALIGIMPIWTLSCRSTTASMSHAPKAESSHPAGQCCLLPRMQSTSAISSVISPGVAQELELVPVGTKPIQTANGTYEAYAYVVDLMLPNKLVIRGVEVSESDLKLE